jgi:hypothetical protein
MIQLDIEEFLDIVYNEYKEQLPKISKEEIIAKILLHYNNKLKYRSKDELSKLKLPQLKELCILNELRKTVNKKDLLERLYAYYKE